MEPTPAACALWGGIQGLQCEPALILIEKAFQVEREWAWSCMRLQLAEKDKRIAELEECLRDILSLTSAPRSSR